MKIILNRLRFDRIMVMSLWPHFLAHPVEILSLGLMYAKKIRQFL